jgi:hypothetical protein
MPTNRMSFASPYQAETPIGQALLNISKAFFSGPGPAAQEAARMAAAKAQLEMDEAQAKATGRERLASLTETATGFQKYAPGRPRDPRDPHWDTNAGSAADFYARYPGELAAAALRSGVDVGQAASGRVLATSSPYFNETARRDAAVGAGRTLGPDSAFTDSGIGEARRYNITKATSAAAAANPDKYHKVALAKEIIGNDRTGMDARRYVGVDPAPTNETSNRREMSRVTGMDETSLAQFDMAQSVLKKYAMPFGGYDMPAFEKQNPELAKVYKDVTVAITRSQNSPRVNGQRPSPDGRGWTIPSPVNGAPVPVERGPDGKWYFRDVDGQTKRIDRPDF